jgi:hypothetical protein
MRRLTVDRTFRDRFEVRPGNNTVGDMQVLVGNLSRYVRVMGSRSWTALTL